MNKYLKQLIAAKQKKQAEINVKLTKALDGGETPDETVEAEIAALEAEVAEIDKNLKRVQDQIDAIKNATENGQEPEAVVDVTKRIKVESNLQKGIGFTLAVKAAAAAHSINLKGGSTNPLEILKSWNAPEEVVNFVKQKAIGTTTNASFAAPLVETTNLAGEFIDLLRPATILGKLSGFLEVPFNVKIPVQTAGGTVNWVGETQIKPNGSLGFEDITLRFSKVAGIVALSDELIRFSNPKADKLVMDSLQRDIANFIDGALLDPSKAETEDSPASLTNGIDPIVSTGQTAATFDADLNAAIEELIEAGESIDGAQWVMSELLASRISQVRDSLGNKYFDGMYGTDKTLLGLPVVTSQSAANVILLVKPSNILLADDAAVDYAVSNEATLTIGGAQVNLFERNLTGIRAERFIRWKPFRRAVAWINYEPVSP